MTIPLRHGVFLAPFHSLAENPTLAFERDLQLCQLLDELGFDEAWIGEHHSAGFETIDSPELFIAAAAERTKHIRFGTGVVSLPYHHPLIVANRIIQLDHMTRGRVMFGAGPGLLASDALMMGIEPRGTRDRMARVARRDPAPVPRRGRHRGDRVVHDARRAHPPAARTRSPIRRSASRARSRRRAGASPASTTSACSASPRASGRLRRPRHQLAGRERDRGRARSRRWIGRGCGPWSTCTSPTTREQAIENIRYGCEEFIRYFNNNQPRFARARRRRLRRLGHRERHRVHRHPRRRHRAHRADLRRSRASSAACSCKPRTGPTGRRRSGRSSSTRTT